MNHKIFEQIHTPDKSIGKMKIFVMNSMWPKSNIKYTHETKLHLLPLPCGYCFTL